MTENENFELEIWRNPKTLTEIKNIYGKGLSDEEFKTFLCIGKSTGLNPFLKEIWAVKYGNNPANIFIGRDGYRKSAQKQKDYESHFVDAVYVNDEFIIKNQKVEHSYCLKDRGALVGAYCICKKKNLEQITYVFVEFKEYTTGRSLWASKPATMIKKVAEAQCLRMAFQELFSATYLDEEVNKTEDVGLENSGFSKAK